MGGMVCTTEGDVVAALTRCYAYLVDPPIAEAICIREVLSWLKSLGIDNFTIASDSLQSVQAINSQNSDDSYFGIVISDCRNLMSTFNSVSLKFITRDSNLFAHKLARVAAFLPNYSVWGGPFDSLLFSTLYIATMMN